AQQTIETCGAVHTRAWTAGAAGERMQPGRVLLEQVPRDAPFALRAAERTRRDHATEVAVALAALDQQQQPAGVLDVDLGADQRAHAGALRGLEEARRAVDAAAIGERQRVAADLRGPLDQVFRQRGAFEEAEGAAAAQLDVVRGGHDFALLSPRTG